jgi:L-aspartate semialdehyde sulfurtransferase ferredoxin
MLWREVAEMKLLVNFSRGKGRKPIIAQVVRDTGVLINVERAVIDSSEGEALIEVPDEQCKLVRDSMANLGANVRILEHGINHDETECVDCGACISICPREVFAFDKEWKLRCTENKCILCGKCVDACPHRALTLPL